MPLIGQDLREQLEKQSSVLDQKPDIDQAELDLQTREFRSRISELEGSEAYLRAENERLERRLSTADQSVTDLNNMTHALQVNIDQSQLSIVSYFYMKFGPITALYNLIS